MTASERYKELLLEMQQEIFKLQDKIYKHSQPENGIRDWDHVGDMAHWLDTIKTITDPK